MNFNDNLDKVLHRLGNGGAFLTVKNGERVNTMTIGWGLIGMQWSLPVFTVLVRPSRLTFELIESAKDFTVSVPKDEQFKTALSICGSKSGRDIDKYKAAGLVLKPARKVTTPVIGGDCFNYECTILYKMPLNSAGITPSVVQNCYLGGDFHTFYFGGIVDCYEN